jgi:hypothetical protein
MPSGSGVDNGILIAYVRHEDARLPS